MGNYQVFLKYISDGHTEQAYKESLTSLSFKWHLSKEA